MDSALLSEIFLIFNVSGDGSNFLICIPFLIFFRFFIQGRQYEHSGVCALLEQVDKKGGFAEYLSSLEIGTLSDCPAKKRNHNC